MIISNKKELLEFFDDNKRAATVAQSNIVRLYAFVRASQFETDESKPKVISTAAIWFECDRASGVECSYGIKASYDDLDPCVELFLTRKGKTAVIALSDGGAVAAITQEVEEIPY